MCCEYYLENRIAEMFGEATIGCSGDHTGWPKTLLALSLSDINECRHDTHTIAVLHCT